MHIDCKQLLAICDHFLKFHDNRLVKHGERVAYIAYNIFNHFEYKDLVELKNLMLLSIFHDIGAYKTEEIDQMVRFETTNVEKHSIYGYLLTKHFSPLASTAEAILYHHAPDSKLKNIDTSIRFYAQLIHLADRVDIAFLDGILIEDLIPKLETMDFDSSCLKALKSAFNNNDLSLQIDDEQVTKWELEIFKSIHISEQETLLYLKMMVHAIDFKNEATVLHSTNVMIVSTILGEKMQLLPSQLESLYYASLVHDIGKAGIPISILEHTGKLSYTQMDTMKKHVLYTNEIIKDILPKDIVDIAIHHHEKLDGSGYPYGLTAVELSISDRIIAISDIVSALSSRRSYKDGYSQDITVHILKDMADNNLIDKAIVNLVCDNYVEIQEIILIKTEPIIKLYIEITNQYNNMLIKSIH